MLFYTTNTSQMTDDAEKAALDAAENSVEELSKKFDEETGDSTEKVDDTGTDSTADSVADSDDSQEKSDEDETETEDSKDDSQEESQDEPDFSFRDTPTNIKNFVAKLDGMTDAERKEKIQSLDPKRNAREIEAAKAKFPDVFNEGETFTISKKDWDELNSKLEKVSQSEEILKSVEQLSKLRPDLEDELADRMLKDKYGSRFEEVKDDPKFKEAMSKLSKLDLPERLEQASMHSKTARELLISTEATKQNKLKALAKKKAGTTKTSVAGYKHSILTEEGIAERFGDRL